MLAAWYGRVLGLPALVIAQGVDYAQFVNPCIGSEGAIPGYACEFTSSFSSSNLANGIQMVVVMYSLAALSPLAW